MTQPEPRWLQRATSTRGRRERLRLKLSAQMVAAGSDWEDLIDVFGCSSPTLAETSLAGRGNLNIEALLGEAS